MKSAVIFCLSVMGFLLSQLLHSSEGLQCYSCEEDALNGRGRCLQNDSSGMAFTTCHEKDVEEELRPYLVCYSMTFRYKNFEDSYGGRYGCFSTYDINKETSGCHIFETETQAEESALEMSDGHMCFCKSELCNTVSDSRHHQLENLRRTSTNGGHREMKTNGKLLLMSVTLLLSLANLTKN